MIFLEPFKISSTRTKDGRIAYAVQMGSERLLKFLHEHNQKKSNGNVYSIPGDVLSKVMRQQLGRMYGEARQKRTLIWVRFTNEV